jgi:hypothetical protein
MVIETKYLFQIIGDLMDQLIGKYICSKVELRLTYLRGQVKDEDS